MNQYCEIFIPLIPKAQGRPRFARAGNYVRTYDDPKSKSYKHDLIVFLQDKNIKPIPADVPITLSVVFILPRPKGHYNAKGEIKDSKADCHHTKKPDLDNMLKALKDAAKGYLWHDDSQICAYEAVRKQYANNDRPGTWVKVFV